MPPPASPPSPRTNSASHSLRAGPVRLAVRQRISTGGIAAVGGLVAGVLLSTAALVWVSTTPVRRHPLSTRLMRR